MNDDLSSGATLQIFDREAALERAGDDEELLAELLEIYQNEWPKLWSAIERGLIEGSASSVASGAHSLKSASGNVGAERAHKACLDLELAGKRDEPADQLHTLAQRLKAEVERFLEEIAS